MQNYNILIITFLFHCRLLNPSFVVHYTRSHSQRLYVLLLRNSDVLQRETTSAGENLTSTQNAYSTFVWFSCLRFLFASTKNSSPLVPTKP